MNAEIERLAELVFDSINAVSPEGVADRHVFEQAWFRLYNQCFASIIIKKCVDIAAMNDDGGCSSSDITAASIARQIKEHFGVEL